MGWAAYWCCFIHPGKPDQHWAQSRHEADGGNSQLVSHNHSSFVPGTIRNEDLLYLPSFFPYKSALISDYLLFRPVEALVTTTCRLSRSPSGFFGSASGFKYLGDLESHFATLCHGESLQGGFWLRFWFIGGTHFLMIGQLSAEVCPESSTVSHEYFCCHQLLSGGSCGLMMTSTSGADKFIQHTHYVLLIKTCICCLYVHNNHGIMQLMLDKPIISKKILYKTSSCVWSLYPTLFISNTFSWLVSTSQGCDWLRDLCDAWMLQTVVW